MPRLLYGSTKSGLTAIAWRWIIFRVRKLVQPERGDRCDIQRFRQQLFGDAFS